MFNYRFYSCFVIAFLINGLLCPSIFSQTYAINGTLEKRGQGTQNINKDSVVRKESLVIEGGKVYIQLLIDQGARRMVDRDRYIYLYFSLPEEVVHDDVSNRIFYRQDNNKIELAREKSFLGFMPY